MNHLYSPTLCRMLFFTDYGNVAKVERCNMDGTNRTRLVDYRIEQPTAVALDVVKKLVYWADAYLDYIDVVDYQGRNRHTIIHGSQVSVALYCKCCLQSFKDSTSHSSQGIWTDNWLHLSMLSPPSFERLNCYMRWSFLVHFLIWGACFITATQVVYSVLWIHSLFHRRSLLIRE